MGHGAQIVLEGTAAYAGDLSMSEVYLVTVTSADPPVTAGSTLTLTVLTDDVGNAAFLVEHQAPARIRLRFSRLRDGEPYATMPISGFVDGQMTSWQLEELEELEEPGTA